MWWKIYFYIFLVAGIFYLFPYFLNIINPRGWLTLITSLAILGAIYSYIYKKSVLRPQSWKILFIITIVTFGLNLLIALFPETFGNLFDRHQELTDGEKLIEVFGTIVTIPAFYAMFKIGFGKY